MADTFGAYFGVHKRGLALNAKRVVDTLYEGGFDVVLSVEHEDPVWGGTEERIETGLRVAHRTLRPLIVA